MLFFCSETLVFSRRHISELMVTRVLVDRCSCSKMRLVGSEGWLTWVKAFQHVDSADVSVDVVKSYLS